MALDYSTTAFIPKLRTSLVVLTKHFLESTPRNRPRTPGLSPHSPNGCLAHLNRFPGRASSAASGMMCLPERNSRSERRPIKNASFHQVASCLRSSSLEALVDFGESNHDRVTFRRGHSIIRGNPGVEQAVLLYIYNDEKYRNIGISKTSILCSSKWKAILDQTLGRFYLDRDVVDASACGKRRERERPHSVRPRAPATREKAFVN